MAVADDAVGTVVQNQQAGEQLAEGFPRSSSSQPTVSAPLMH
jgi:hypothetical protein